LYHLSIKSLMYASCSLVNETEDLEKHLLFTHEDLQALMPNRIIDIEASVAMTNFGTGVTYMSIAAYYGEEKRFIKFT